MGITMNKIDWISDSNETGKIMGITMNKIKSGSLIKMKL